MALSPTIPTSFVPKQPVSPGVRRSSSGDNIFLYVACAILGIAVLLAIGTFFYAQYLTGVQNAKAAELVAAQAQVSPSSVDDFVRLHNRFIAASSILSQHIALSQFFTLLGSITVQNVSFTSLDIEVADDRSAQITMMGEAKDFNSLAAESTVFGEQKNITSAIFSGITVNKDGTIGFSVSADLTPALVVESAPPTTPVLIPSSTATAATSSPSFAAAVQAAVASSSAAVPAVTTTMSSSTSTTTP